MQYSHLVGIGAIWQAAYVFLLIFHCNYVSSTVSETFGLLSITKMWRGHMTLNAFPSEQFIMHAIVFVNINQHTKFEMLSFTQTKDTIAAQKCEKWATWLRDYAH